MIAKIITQDTIEVYDLTQFDPYAILHSGQVFRYNQIDENNFFVISAHHWAKLTVLTNKVVITCSNANYFYQYFDLATDYNAIKKQLNFTKLNEAIKWGGGIRILRADFIETVISFIISANNNIKRFTKTLNNLCTQFGTKLFDNYYAFPNLAQLEQITQTDFKNLGCGYRDQYLIKAIQQLKALNLQDLMQLPTDLLLKELTKICGVGLKVAACIALFACHRYEVAPIDTWMRKAIAQLSDDEQKLILSGPYSGVAQQYIFYYLQHLKQDIL